MENEQINALNPEDPTIKAYCILTIFQIRMILKLRLIELSISSQNYNDKGIIFFSETYNESRFDRWENIPAGKCWISFESRYLQVN